jgi:hypothetical protein
VGGSRGPAGPRQERLHASALSERPSGMRVSGGSGGSLLGNGGVEDGSGWETQRRRRLVIVELPSLEAGRETDGANHMLSEARAVATSMNALIKVLQLRCHPHPGTRVASLRRALTSSPTPRSPPLTLWPRATKATYRTEIPSSLSC